MSDLYMGRVNKTKFITINTDLFLSKNINAGIFLVVWLATEMALNK
jgi:hypothetical protein